jgi:type II protein arginine methyltransferase
MKMDRTGAIEALISRVEGNPAAMVALARQMISAGDRAGAARLCLQATEDPSCPIEARTYAAELLSAEIPRWHFIIVRDQARNAAYEAALRHAIFPGCTVLEIGTGTGLLAMMAARAGAARVFTCEADPVVALAAEKVIARNGYADRVQVIAKHSTDLDADTDLGGRADILVSEIVSNDLIGEGALPAMEHAIHHLLKPGAAVIPARGHVRVALADDQRDVAAWMTTVCGFDLTPFDCLAKPFREIGVGDPGLLLRGEAIDLFSFDFASGGPFPAQSVTTRLLSSGGMIGGTAQWIALEMGDGGVYENRPARGAGSCWAAVYRPFARALKTHHGESIELSARHDRASLSLWTARDADDAGSPKQEQQLE